MLKFFRRIRRKLLDTGNLKRYLIYAIGEIILVIIGILIALQINNRNENFKNEQALNRILDLLDQDLINNIEKANDLLSVHIEKDAEFTAILEKNSNRPKWVQSLIIRTIFDSPREFSVKSEKYVLFEDNLNRVLSKEDEFPEKYDFLFPTLKFYAYHISAYKEHLKKAEEYNLRERNFLIDKYNWFTPVAYKEEINLGQKKFDDLMLDPVFQTKLSIAKELNVSLQIGYLSSLRATAIGLLAQIQHLRGQLNHELLKQLFHKYGLVPFNKGGCDVNFERDKSDYNGPFGFLFFNYLNKPVEVIRLDEGRQQESIIIPPVSFIVNSTYYSFFASSGRAFESKTSTECIAKYQSVVDGYLLIE